MLSLDCSLAFPRFTIASRLSSHGIRGVLFLRAKTKRLVKRSSRMVNFAGCTSRAQPAPLSSNFGADQLRYCGRGSRACLRSTNANKRSIHSCTVFLMMLSALYCGYEWLYSRPSRIGDDLVGQIVSRLRFVESERHASIVQAPKSLSTVTHLDM